MLNVYRIYQITLYSPETNAFGSFLVPSQILLKLSGLSDMDIIPKETRRPLRIRNKRILSLTRARVFWILRPQFKKKECMRVMLVRHAQPMRRVFHCVISLPMACIISMIMSWMKKKTACLKAAYIPQKRQNWQLTIPMEIDMSWLINLKWKSKEVGGKVSSYQKTAWNGKTARSKEFWPRE